MVLDRGIHADLARPTIVIPAGVEGGPLLVAGMIVSLSGCHRVMRAHSTLTGSAMSMSVSTTTTCFMEPCPSIAASMALLPSPSCLGLIWTTAASHPEPPSVRWTSVHSTTSDTAFLMVGALGSPMSVRCSLSAGISAWKTALSRWWTAS